MVIRLRAGTSIPSDVHRCDRSGLDAKIRQLNFRVTIPNAVLA